MRRTARWIAALAVLGLCAVSLAPLAETNLWWVRFLDFPRLQIAAALLVGLAVYLALGGGRSLLGKLLAGLAVLAIGYHAYKLQPYVPLSPAMTAQACAAEDRLRILVVNVKRDSREADALLETIAAREPDIVLVMETNEWWDRQLAPLDASFAHHLQHVPEEATHYGIHLFSRYPLVEPQIRFGFGPDTPAVLTGVTLPSGDIVELYGIHPRPPLYWSQPSTLRDATILAAALEAGASERPSILAGDLNAVPWERTTRRAMRLGGFLDPREGRGLYPTYDANSAWKSWPLDQVLYQPQFTLLSFERLPGIGSDHYPVLAALCHSPDAADRQSPPAPVSGDVEEAQASMRAAAALMDAASGG